MNLGTFALGYLLEFCNFYPYLTLETEFSALKPIQIYCINMINMNTSFLENRPFNHKLAPHLLNTYFERLSMQPHKI